jgi:hypothetical protein
MVVARGPGRYERAAAPAGEISASWLNLLGPFAVSSVATVLAWRARSLAVRAKLSAGGVDLLLSIGSFTAWAVALIVVWLGN